MTVENVDHIFKSVTFRTDSGRILMVDGRVVSQSGFVTPIEQKQMYRQFNSIIKN